MIILALDQATVNTAYSVWVNSKLITHGKVTADEKIKDYRRSLQMVDLVMKKVEEYKPDLVVLKELFQMAI